MTFVLKLRPASSRGRRSRRLSQASLLKLSGALLGVPSLGSVKASLEDSTEAFETSLRDVFSSSLKASLKGSFQGSFEASETVFAIRVT